MSYCPEQNDDKHTNQHTANWTSGTTLAQIFIAAKAYSEITWVTCQSTWARKQIGFSAAGDRSRLAKAAAGKLHLGSTEEERTQRSG